MISKIKQLQQFLIAKNYDFFIQENTDQFGSEYLPTSEKKIEFLTGFTGSNAILIVAQQKSFFFTDGRYLLQAKSQLDSSQFETIDLGSIGVFEWLSQQLKSTKKNQFSFAIDSKICNLLMKKRFEALNESLDEGKDKELDSEQKNLQLILLDKNPIDEIFNETWRNQANSGKSSIYFLSNQASGLDSLTKRKEIIEKFTKNAKEKAKLMLISKPENLCWLLNLRAGDVENTPLLLAYGLLMSNGKAVVFADEKRLKTELKIEANIEFVDPNKIFETFKQLRKDFDKILIDESATNCWIWQQLKVLDFEIIHQSCPIEEAKSIKNNAEIEGSWLAHELDAVALLKFWIWLDEGLQNGKKIDELQIGKKIDELRALSPYFVCPSFSTISGFAENGAVIHYRATEESNLELNRDSILLLDSGGQYLRQDQNSGGKDFMATTDITRCFAIGKPNAEMIRAYTLVLKGHLALSRLKFPCKSCGMQLDSLARFYLWQFGKDYAHGTGHGVGSFLSVHEGPAAISRRNSAEILPGMILSNEPGFYETNQFGIRIENLLLVREFDSKFLTFETLSLVPYESKLIDFSMLTYPEKIWLQSYHQKIISRLKPYLSGVEQQFLVEKSREFLG